MAAAYAAVISLNCTVDRYFSQRWNLDPQMNSFASLIDVEMCYLESVLDNLNEGLISKERADAWVERMPKLTIEEVMVSVLESFNRISGEYDLVDGTPEWTIIKRGMESFLDNLNENERRISEERAAALLEGEMESEIPEHRYFAFDFEELKNIVSSSQGSGVKLKPLELLELKLLGATESLISDLCYFEEFQNKIRSWQRSKNFDALAREIKELVERIEDLIESHLSDIRRPEDRSSRDRNRSLTAAAAVFSQSLSQLMQQLHSFIRALITTQTTSADFKEDQQQPASFSVADVVSSRVDFGGTTEMVGMEGNAVFRKLRYNVACETRPATLSVLSLWGMAGIGKTTLAKRVFQDPLVADHYDTRLFLQIGPHEYHFRKCLLLALHQLGYGVDEMTCQTEEEKLKEYLYGALHNGGRYLIVLDDVWDTKVWDDLKPCFPDDKNGSRIILTTRIRDIINYASGRLRDRFLVPFLTKSESWDLLRKTIFADKDKSSCHLDHKLEKLGRKIAENCEGLPLAIVEIGQLLRNADITVENWKRVAEDENPLNIRAGDDTPISKTLSLGYDRLSIIEKVIFLYLGLFPKGYEFTCSGLTNLFVSEGLLFNRKHYGNLSVGDLTQFFCGRLLANSLIVLTGASSFQDKGKSYILHSLYRTLCVSQAQNENFFHVINKLDNSFPEGIKSQRRLSIQNRTLVCFKQVQSTMESISNVRSLLFFGQKDQQPLRLYLGYRLLRVLYALTNRFYEFPHQLVDLVHLRYIAIRYDGRDIPPSISMLLNLETLIIQQYNHSIMYPDGPVYLPVGIWKIYRLMHLECEGFDLPDPSPIEGGSHNSLVLAQLLKLSGVSDHSCSKGVLARLPNLTKLRVVIVRGLILDAVVETSFDFFGDVADLCDRIESVTCAVRKPDHGSRVFPSMPKFHINITKIHLSGCGIGWENMEHIGRLPNLKVLKLHLYAFRGALWETVEGGFLQLKCLLLQDLDIEHWSIGNAGHFPSLEYLLVRDCYKLQEIPIEVGDMPTLNMLAVFDCSPRACQRLWEHLGKSEHPNLEVMVYRSWDSTVTRMWSPGVKYIL